MKVICVNNGPMIGRDGDVSSCKELIEGKVYNVNDSKYNSDAYEVDGHRFCPEVGGYVDYYKSRFIPLSEIDETELAEQRLQHA